MKQFSFSFLSCAVVALVAGPLLARADSKPNFDDDAKPILNQQPGLVQYVESSFQVKETGIAKYPGDDDHAPVPPYIFRARARGSNGPYNLRLFIQPGPQGHILGVYPDASTTPQQPAVATTPATSHQPAPAPQAPAQQQPSQLTSDTPSGPIGAPSNTSVPSSNSPNLAPPPDPAPQPH